MYPFQHGGHITKDLYGGVPMGGEAAAPTLSFSAVTTGAETLTLQRITPTGGTCTVTWGDGSADTVIADGNTGTTTHNYAGAGTWAVTISNPDLITYLDLRDAKIGCTSGTIGSLTNLTYLYLNSLANVTIGAGEIGSLTDLTSLTLYNLVNCAFQTGLASLLKLTTLRYENNLTQANMDSLAAQLYAAFPTRTGTNGTIDLLGGGNAAPTGVSPGGAECPPTTGYNIFYELVNDSCNISAKHWASVALP